MRRVLISGRKKLLPPCRSLTLTAAITPGIQLPPYHHEDEPGPTANSIEIARS